MRLPLKSRNIADAVIPDINCKVDDAPASMMIIIIIKIIGL